MHRTQPITLQAIGVNHNTAPIDVREQLTLIGERLALAYENVKQQPRIIECVILSTCNRFELYFVAQEDQRQEPERPAKEALLDLFAEDGAHLRDYAYYHEGPAAVGHLFKVACGIDSLVPGEVQILGQVQRAWQEAHKADAVGPVLSQLFHRGVALGKRVHSETSISRRPASVSYAAVVLAKQILGTQLHAGRVLVIGTGEVGEGVARCLHEHGFHATVVAHLHLERAHSVARRYEAEVAAWDDLPVHLASADVVISSTAAPHTVLQREQIQEAISRRPDRPLYLIDLAVPRDIDPAAAHLPGVYLHNIDDLYAVVHTTLEERRTALPQIEGMVNSEVREFTRWLNARTTFPTIKTLREQADEVTERELQWAMSKLPGLTQRERAVVEAMAARITGKLLHGPIQWLKAQAESSMEPDYGMASLDARQFADLFLSGTDLPDSEEADRIG
jgi:glutamyl-tRNA reductase